MPRRFFILAKILKERTSGNGNMPVRAVRDNPSVDANELRVSRLSKAGYFMTALLIRDTPLQRTAEACDEY